eukprot:3554301-Rhodomonas_salina.1
MLTSVWETGAVWEICAVEHCYVRPPERVGVVPGSARLRVAGGGALGEAQEHGPRAAQGRAGLPGPRAPALGRVQAARGVQKHGRAAALPAAPRRGQADGGAARQGPLAAQLHWRLGLGRRLPRRVAQPQLPPPRDAPARPPHLRAPARAPAHRDHAARLRPCCLPHV